jgi:hypothetical protein
MNFPSTSKRERPIQLQIKDIRRGKRGTAESEMWNEQAGINPQNPSARKRQKWHCRA